MLRSTLLLFLLAQPPASFEVASIRGHPAGRGESTQFSPGSVTMRNVTLRSALRQAYHVMDFQVQGPAWLSLDRYDIVAKSSTPSPEAELRVMLQALLAERFKVELHRQTKEVQAYVLLVGRGGPKFHESKSDGEPSMQMQKEKFGSIVVERAPLSQLTDLLSRLLQAPVVDMTGLTGRYDITVDATKYLADLQPSSGPPDIMSVVIAGLQGELGLKLESKKTPIEFLIVDRAEKTPAEN